MFLENDKIRLRAVEPEDLELLYKWENNPAYWHAGEVRVPYSKYTLKQYILNASQDIYESKQLRFMIEPKQQHDKLAIGTIDLFDLDVFNSRIGVGLLIDEPYRGNGFAGASLELVEEYVFGFLKLNQLYAHVAEDNNKSRNLFESRNFQSSGMLKNWIRSGEGYVNVILYQLFQP
ncbi:N-acetyltransferase [Paludibacter sp. 221]|uniref:GNAT family N-acetyltransferase n=1 Tax=Paludibacter sp. 221 TaxID=2302939 RepID=UPI0013D617F0|nr:GNAT family N-acetyltransferase [Paludibacter sp. 221]NDV47859.1 N-acetyltransferase [Paludibacter sp. 221]